MLNTGGQLVVDYGAQARRVLLERGEAYFEVAEDRARPFTVDLGLRSVTAVGTAFNVRKDPERFQVAVTDGAVAFHGAERVHGHSRNRHGHRASWPGAGAAHRPDLALRPDRDYRIHGERGCGTPNRKVKTMNHISRTHNLKVLPVLASAMLAFAYAGTTTQNNDNPVGAGDTEEYRTGGINVGISTVNLRALGSANTLVLLNGRRTAGVAGVEDNYANLVNVPLSAIERVDIQLDGSSAVYGADPVYDRVNRRWTYPGEPNIITAKQSATSPRFGIQYGPTEEFIVRGSWSESFRPPVWGDLFSLTNSTVYTFFRYVDPCSLHARLSAVAGLAGPCHTELRCPADPATAARCTSSCSFSERTRGAGESILPAARPP